MRNPRPFHHKHLHVIQRMMVSRTGDHEFVDVELSSEEKEAINALIEDRAALSRQCYNLEILLDGEIERAKWRNMGDRGWATFERLKKIWDQRGKD